MKGANRMINTRDPEPLLPLTPGVFHVLLVLAGGDTHGYAILKEVSYLTGGAVSLSAGTLYAILRRLVRYDTSFRIAYPCVSPPANTSST